MLNKIIIGLMAILLGWTIYSNFGDGVLKKEDAHEGNAPIHSSEEEQDTESVPNPATEDRKDSIETESPPSAQIGLTQGDLAPEFSLPTLVGEEMSLADYRGQKVIVNFWASWCPPCRAEMPDMVKFYEEYKDKDVEILGVNLLESEKSLDNVEQFIAEFGINFPILFDEESETATTYQSYSIPTTYFVDTQGVIQQKVIGPMNYDLMVRVIEQME